MKVAIYGMTKKGIKGGQGDRGDLIGQAMAAGLDRHGVKYSRHTQFEGVVADVAVAYGWIHELKDKVFSAYRDAGAHFVFLDLGYWNRGNKGAYRVAVDDWDSATHMLRDCSDDRFKSSKIQLQDNWNRDSKEVMIVGMSDKAAWTHGYKFNEWENSAKAFLERKYAGHGLKFTIRQKPRGKETLKVPSIDEALKKVRFVVSHHSNVGVDCLISGVPYTCKKGVAKHLAPITDPDAFVADAPILDPYFPDPEARQSLLSDIAYVQWSVSEMNLGHCWNYVREILEV